MSNSVATQDIILPKELQDFISPADLRKAFVSYRKACEESNQLRTLPGLCRALNISKEEYLQYRNGEYKKEFEQMELSIKHDWINQGINKPSAWRYLESEFPDDYKKDPTLTPPNINIIVGMQIINESNAPAIQK